MQLGIVTIPTILHVTVGPLKALTVFSTLTAEPACRRQVADIRPIDPSALAIRLMVLGFRDLGVIGPEAAGAAAH